METSAHENWLIYQSVSAYYQVSALEVSKILMKVIPDCILWHQSLDGIEIVQLGERNCFDSELKKL